MVRRCVNRSDQPPSVVVLDVILPGCSGVAAAGIGGSAGRCRRRTTPTPDGWSRPPGHHAARAAGGARATGNILEVVLTQGGRVAHSSKPGPQRVQRCNTRSPGDGARGRKVVGVSCRISVQPMLGVTSGARGLPAALGESTPSWSVFGRSAWRHRRLGVCGYPVPCAFTGKAAHPNVPRLDDDWPCQPIAAARPPCRSLR
jgi:hypothetical protein